MATPTKTWKIKRTLKSSMDVTTILSNYTHAPKSQDVPFKLQCQWRWKKERSGREQITWNIRNEMIVKIRIPDDVTTPRDNFFSSHAFESSK